MLQIYPPFYKRFRCMASACPDSCCVGWEVVDDDAALEEAFRYDPAFSLDALLALI